MGILNVKALRDWILLRGVNHMLATEKGFFMDARLGPVIQGELDKLKADVGEINSNLTRTLIATTDTVDLADIGILNTGAYTISQSTLNKPDGVLDFGIMLVMARGSNKTGFIISWNGGASQIVRLHVFTSSKNCFTQVN